MDTSRVVEAGVSAAAQGFGLDFLHDLPHRLTRPDTVRSLWRSGEQLAEAYVSDVAPAKFRARLAN